MIFLFAALINLSFAVSGNDFAAKKCRNYDQKYKSECSQRGDIMARLGGAVVSAFQYDSCRNGEITVQVIVNHNVARDGLPAHLSCDFGYGTPQGSTYREIANSLGNTLTVEANVDATKSYTKITTKEGELMCLPEAPRGAKASSATTTTGPVRYGWCGLRLTGQEGFTETHMVSDLEMRELLFNKLNMKLLAAPGLIRAKSIVAPNENPSAQ